jgi:transcription initiation factor TFIIF subunit beta
MPLNELLDLIHDCFKKYEYWPLKVLKNELKQPEAYLKQTLERVAHLVRQGPHAMTWQIKPEFKSSVVGDAHSYDEARDKEAPDDNYGLNDDSEMGTEEDDDGVKLEDVMPK